MKKWYEKARFTDPDYGTDVTDGVRAVLRKQRSENVLGMSGDGELVKVSVSYITRRGNVRRPERFIMLPDCPQEDDKLRDRVERVIKAEFDLRNAHNPYRAVRNVEISAIERYAEVSA